MSDIDHSFQDRFDSYARELLSHEPNLNYELARGEKSNWVSVTFLAINESGFDVTIVANKHGVEVSAGNLAHVHFDLDDHTGETIRDSFGLVRDLLSPRMRLCERRTNGKTYSATIEFSKDGNWFLCEKVVSFIWNYFGKRSRVILTNSQLPSRLS